MLQTTRLQGLRCTCSDVDGDGLSDSGDIALLDVLMEASDCIIYAAAAASAADVVALAPATALPSCEIRPCMTP